MIAIKICMQNVRKWSSNPRIIMCFVLMAAFIMTYTRGLRELCLTLDTKMNPWIFPYLMTYRYMKIIYLILFIFMLSDAPFIDFNQVSVILRTNRKNWCVGQVLYVIAASFMYTFGMMVVSVIVNIRYIQWGLNWGDVLGKLGTTNILAVLGSDYKYTTVAIIGMGILYYTPIQAMILSFLVQFLSYVVMGMVIYFFNSIGKTKTFGVIMASIMTILTAVADLRHKFVWFSPMSWNTINNIDVANSTGFPGYSFIISIYSAVIIVLIVLSLLLVRKQEIIVSGDS